MFVNGFRNLGQMEEQNCCAFNHVNIGGSRGGVPAHAPPMGPNSFVFAYIFTEKCPRRRSTPPLTGARPPPPREILDPPLVKSILVWCIQLKNVPEVPLSSSRYEIWNTAMQPGYLEMPSFLLMNRNRFSTFSRNLIIHIRKQCITNQFQ